MTDKNRTENKTDYTKGIRTYIIITILVAFGAQTGFILIYQKCIGGNYTEAALSSFYSTLFTIIAVIVGIAALISWRRIQEFTEKLEQFKEIESRVNRLHKKKDLADWAKGIVAGTGRGCITSFDIQYEGEDRKKANDTIATLSDEYTENGWLEVIYAKDIFTTNKSDGDRFRKAFNIYNLIIQKNIVNHNHDTSLEGVVYHLLGQVFWEYYNEIKENFCKVKKGESKKIFDEWCKQKAYDISDKMVFKSGIVKDDGATSRTIPVKDILYISFNYYAMALEIKKKKDKNWDETLANLAVVLVELHKIINKTERKKLAPLVKAETYLNEIPKDKITFNTYWDLARIYFYKDKDEYTNEIRNNLENAVDCIENSRHKGVFLKGIKDEYDETGFPGKDDLIEELRKKLDPKTI